jgi:hypothetical protein
MFPALLLIVFAVVYRIATLLLVDSGMAWLSNFAPLAAIALCGAVYFPAKLKFTVPLVALFISDAILNYHYNAPLLDPLMLCRYLALAAVCCVGWMLQNRASLRPILGASIVCSTFFYLLTNTFSWMTDPGYVKNFAGLIQALTVGLPQYSATPTWMFFRNSLLSDLIFTALFVACINYSRNVQRSRATAAIPRPA